MAITGFTPSEEAFVDLLIAKADQWERQTHHLVTARSIMTDGQPMSISRLGDWFTSMAAEWPGGPEDSRKVGRVAGAKYWMRENRHRN